MLTKDTIEVIERAMGLHSRLVTVQFKLEAVPATDKRYVACGAAATSYRLVCESIAAACVRLILGDK